jgi:predicted GNAT family N-acyltransferase
VERGAYAPAAGRGSAMNRKSTEIKIEELKDSDAGEAWQLVRNVFNACVAPDYSKEGILKYYSFVNFEFIRKWKTEGRICLAAKAGSKIAGIIDIKDTNHLTMFFVNTKLQNFGIGRKLLTEAIMKCKTIYPGLSYFEVNSSPFAVKIYEKLGFAKQSGEQEQFGIRYTPMRMDIKKTA